MPIDIKVFDEGTFIMRSGAIIKVLDFLKKNKTKAYTSMEISNALNSKQVIITPLLRKLRNAKIVIYKYPYYALTSLKISEIAQKEILMDIEKETQEKRELLKEKKKARKTITVVTTEPNPEPNPEQIDEPEQAEPKIEIGEEEEFPENDTEDNQIPDYQ